MDNHELKAFLKRSNKFFIYVCHVLSLCHFLFFFQGVQQAYGNRPAILLLDHK